MVSDETREGSLLTEAQRKYLRGDSEIEPGSGHERAMRSRIRSRIQSGLLDFRIVFDELAENDRDKIVEAEDAYDRAQLHDGMVAAVALFYEMCDRSGWPFAELLERAVKNVYRNPDRSPEQMVVRDVEFDVSLESPRSREDVERAALLKFLRGAELTDREYRVLTEPAGLIINPETDQYLSREEILEVLRDRRNERDQEKRREESRKRIELDQDVFGEGYSIPPDLREKLDEEE